MLQKNKILTGMLGVMLLSGNGIAHAVEQGDWLLRFGVTMVSPDASSSGVVADDAVDVDDGTSVSVDFTYMLRENIGIELLAAYPFPMTLRWMALVKLRKPINCHRPSACNTIFNRKATCGPMGIGLNYTMFFNEEATAVISDISLDDSVGLALQGGVDFNLTDKWYLNLVLRYINIETTAETNLGNVDVDINPWVYTLGVGTSF